jgi:hypothetical protein
MEATIDPISQDFKIIHQQKGERVRFSEDILAVWKRNIRPNSILAELENAMQYRHWLAHGRYWVAKTGRKYDFRGIMTLAQQLQQNLPIKTSD